MPKKRAVILRLKTWAVLRRMIRDYLAGRLTNRSKWEEPRRWPRGGAGRCDTIRFHITSVVPSTRTALCIIDAVPNGFTVADVPGASVLGDEVFVTDPLGCYFSEPTGELVGRKGWAHYMKPQPGAGGPGATEGYEVPQWEVFALCCDPPACDA